MTTPAILCPVDFSAASKCAARMAGELAHAQRADLELLHVYEIPVMVLPEGPVMVSAEYLSSITEAAQRSLNEQCRALETAGIQATTKLLQGPLAPTIIEEAKKIGASMIVMGTHGRSGLQRLLLGSVAERVVRTAPMSVLTVRDDSSP